ncbi:ATP-dependent helicase BRM [Capsicum chinense]|nr:ATP-dependent helicase BRM [Capsicum chinense]
MQSGGGGQQGGVAGAGGGHGRNTAASASASPSSSSSAASHMGLDQQQQQQLHQQQQQQRQSLQQQFLRRTEGNEAILAFQTGSAHGILGGGNFVGPSGSVQLPQQSRRYIEQHGSPTIREDGQNRSQAFEQQMLNPVQQAYLQYAYQAAQQKSALGLQQQQMKMGIFCPSAKDQDPRIANLKMQELVAMQASNQAQASSSKLSSEQHFSRGEKQSDQGQQLMTDQRQDTKLLSQPALLGQTVATKPMQAPPPSQQNMANMTSNSLAMAAQMQAMQALALERNVDLSLPANANIMAQLIPLMQSRMITQQKVPENNVPVQSSSGHMPKQQVSSPQIANDSSPHAHSSSDLSGSSSAKTRQAVTTGPLGMSHSVASVNNPNSVPQQQFSAHGRENNLPPRQPIMGSSGLPPMHYPQSSVNPNQGVDNTVLPKPASNAQETLQTQYARQLSRPSPHSAASSPDANLGNSLTSQGGNVRQVQQQHLGFSKQQLHVLKAQILAFRRIKKGDGTLPRELLQAITPPPLDVQMQQTLPPGGTVNQEKPSGKGSEDNRRRLESSEKGPQLVVPSDGLNGSKEEVRRDESTAAATTPVPGSSTETKETALVVPRGKEEQPITGHASKVDQDADRTIQNTPSRGDIAPDRGKAVASQVTGSDTTQAKKPMQSSATQQKDTGPARKYHGPLFDFSFFTRKHDAFGPSMMMNNNNNLTLAYELKDLLVEEGSEFHKRKREESIKKIGDILAINLERKRIRPDLVLRLQIEEKKLQLADIQARMRDEIDQQQQEIMAMPDRHYRKFVRLCERQRQDLSRQVQASQKAIREKQLKTIFQWRKKLLEAHWAIRDARTARNRGVAKYHERMLREFSKKKDDNRNERMEALKNNDVERYREMLLEQQTNVPGDGAERYAVISSFLSQTEEYLHKLGGKITAAKKQQEVEEAANAAAVAARAQGLSEEEVRAAAACAREEVMIRNRFSEMNAPRDGSSVNKYYHLAHAVNEMVIRQPSMLRAGTLRDYQLVGLQWMLSLYNNKLNGILADEMGLGKTVQVMALIAYLMEFKQNYGPHLIIVPNAVLVNWKSEFLNWLPSASCIFYVGSKDQRSKLFSQEVCAMKFNVLVTTYEFIMYDRAKLSKVDWKYIIIDEAQRMKDRESVLARDLDRYRCQRRLLLTGTPLQNDLKELWSLLNLLLPEVFDNRKAFHDWFSKPFQKEGPTNNSEDDWLETEKKVIVIHRLHQILEPFMLRRRVEDVEGSLPPKVSVVLRCRMSGFQSAVYDWIKSTGTLRVDLEDEQRRTEKNPNYQPKTYKVLNNRCMELRKTCNHPLLNYPYLNVTKDFLVKSCGKLWVLDRILIKLQRTGHRVLLFSTMTKLLDILEEYLQWRRLIYRRIDGTTSLEDRESAIVDFNSPDTDCFIFLLSIRAAGRGLNLQTADTVIIYDPDPNPKNEEQAVARAHRIGQKREVKVIYMEAVVDKIASHQKEDEYRVGVVDSDDDLAGKDRYIGSIESLIRNNIQQYKIDMADEVINAGRFDQMTTHEERRLTLETLLHDEERYQETLHDVPSLQEVNRMIARSEEEVEQFDQMDEEFDWEEEMTRYDQVPKWLRATSKEVNTAIANLAKKPSKNVLFSSGVGVDSSGLAPESEKKRGRPKGKKVPIYTELDDDNGEFSEASSGERNGYSANEEGEIGEFEDDEFNGAIDVTPANKDQSEEDGPSFVGRYEYHQGPQGAIKTRVPEQVGSSGSSSDNQRSKQIVSSSVSSQQKFGSLSALDARPSSRAKKMADELEEGEIAVSGDSHVDLQQSGSWIQDRDEGEEEQVLQPKIKRKRSLRVRPRHAAERPEETLVEKPAVQRGDSSSQMAFQGDRRYDLQMRNDRGHKTHAEPSGPKNSQSDASFKSKRSIPSRKSSSSSVKVHGSGKPGKVSRLSPDDAFEPTRDSWDNKLMNASGSFSGGTKMSEVIQRKCKTVIIKLQKKIEKGGQQIIPLLHGLWKRIDSTGCMGGSEDSLFGLQTVDLRVDESEYSGVLEFVSDVQLMLKRAVQYFGFSHEVRSEARKVHDLFFDILKLEFPETDFREARNSISFSGPAASTTPGASSRLMSVGQNKRHKLMNEMEHDSSPLLKSQTRGVHHAGEDSKAKSHVAHRETRFGGSSSREINQQDDSRPFTHPGELVICKKKRKDREKLVLKSGSSSGGPVSPPVVSRSIRSPGSLPTAKEGGRLNQQTPHQLNGSGSSSVGWANPVKRLRSDSARRRQSHL